MDSLIVALIFFLAGVGVGTFVVGSLIRKIVAETKSAILAEFYESRLRVEGVVAELENRAKTVAKAL